MKNNTAPRKTLTAVLAVAMAAGLTGCGSSLAANTNNYFTNVSSILHTLQTNGKQQAASSSTVSNDGSQLATPTDFTVDESGNYSFTGVEIICCTSAPRMPPVTTTASSTPANPLTPPRATPTAASARMNLIMRSVPIWLRSTLSLI